MAYYIDVILPIPVEKSFTYQVNEDEARFLKAGMRVAVPFGRSKIYAALVKQVHKSAPQTYKAKEIDHIIDEKPIVTSMQLQLWLWISSYYMCTEGEVLRAALPGTFLLESETIIHKRKLDTIPQDQLTDAEFIVVEALHHQSQLQVGDLMQLLDRKKVLPIIARLIDKGVVQLHEELREIYTPKITKYIRLHKQYDSEVGLQEVLNILSRAKRQREVVLQYFSLKAKINKPVEALLLQKQARATAQQLKSLVEKGIFEIYELQEDRINFTGETIGSKTLSEPQEQAFSEIKKAFTHKDVCLLHGVTASGKTEVYVQLIQEHLAKNEQVLYLLPEIALTTQLIKRLQAYFGDKVAVFHSKYSLNERTEVWDNVLHNKTSAQLIIGARSAIFLPFHKLGLVIVDEEHDSSYKQFDPAPRYHARDTAIVLGQLFQAKVLLGSATPSVESYNNALVGKYALVKLVQRYGNILLPEINLVNSKEKHRKRLMTDFFSDTLLRAITDTLAEKEQVIIFQNRRGFAPIMECMTCGHTPQCPNCDVSLTYHKYRNQLRCHYCGYHMAVQEQCQACGNSELNAKGIGTEQIELALKTLYPDAKIARMDADTTRGKYAFEKLIDAFETEEIDILVGTQMVTKGLDFRKVSLVGVIQADSMLNYPDFRAHERSYQLIAQVAGRAGRTAKRGKVLVQTYNPYHQILQQVSVNNYEGMITDQLEERRQYRYPPYHRLIKITLKHKDFAKVESAASWLCQSLKNSLTSCEVLGPETPVIARIRNLYHKNILVKIGNKVSPKEVKRDILRVQVSFKSIAQFRSVRLVLDVDNQA